MGLMTVNGWRITFSSLQVETDTFKEIVLFMSSLLHHLLFILPLTCFLLPFFLDCLKHVGLTGMLLFYTFQTCFLSLVLLFSYLHRTSIMALNIGLHPLLSTLIYILLFLPLLLPCMPLLYSCLYSSNIKPILSKELSRSGSVFFRELPSLTVIADVFLSPLRHQ